MVSWNVQTELLACLDSVLASTGVEVRPVVVDNASTDDSADAVAAHHPNMALIRNDTNVGFARAVNQGIAAGSAPWVLLLNPDTLVPRDALALLVARLDQLPKHAMLVPRLTDADGNMQQSAFLFPSIPISVTVALGAHHLLPEVWKRRWLIPGHWGLDEQDVPWAIGAVMLLRRQVIERIGPLDESFFVYGEDMEWCHRIRSVGLRIRFTPKVSVVHYGNRSGIQRFGDERIRVYLANTLSYQRRLRGPVRAWSLFSINAASAVIHALVVGATARLRPTARRRQASDHWTAQARGHLGVLRHRPRLRDRGGRTRAG